MKRQYILLTTKKNPNKRNKITKIIQLFKNNKFTIPFMIISIFFFSYFIIFIKKSHLTHKTTKTLNYANNIIECTILLNIDNITLNLSNPSSIIIPYEENITLNNTTEVINTTNIILNNNTNITLNNTDNTQYTNITLNNTNNTQFINITLNNTNNTQYTNITLNNTYIIYKFIKYLFKWIQKRRRKIIMAK